MNIQYAGDRILIEGADGYKYLFFSREKSFDDGYDPVIVYDSQGDEIARLAKDDEDANDVWHQYVMDISNADGNIVIENVEDFENIFNEVTLY